MPVKDCHVQNETDLYKLIFNELHRKKFFTLIAVLCPSRKPFVSRLLLFKIDKNAILIENQENLQILLFVPHNILLDVQFISM
jgi:hypothetical protein